MNGGLIDVYEATRGNVDVIKEITGSGAGQQGEIAVLVACGGPVNNFVMRIPAHTPVGSVSRFITNIPAGSDCLVSEPITGRTDAVAVAAHGGGQTVSVAADGTATAHLTDRFTAVAAPSSPAAASPALAATGSGGNVSALATWGGDRHGRRRDAARRGIAMAATLRRKTAGHRLAATSAACPSRTPTWHVHTPLRVARHDARNP